MQKFTFNFIVNVGKSFGQQCKNIHQDNNRTVQKHSPVSLLVTQNKIRYKLFHYFLTSDYLNKSLKKDRQMNLQSKWSLLVALDKIVWYTASSTDTVGKWMKCNDEISTVGLYSLDHDSYFSKLHHTKKTTVMSHVLEAFRQFSDVRFGQQILS